MATRVLRTLLRMVSWILLATFILFSIIGLATAFRKFFFVSNSHFILRSTELEIHGDTGELKIRKIIEDLGIIEGETNIFAVNPRHLREQISECLPIKRTCVQRRLPDTIVVQIFESEPVAYLRQRGQMLVDGDGTIMPPSEREYKDIPLITPVRGGELAPGGSVTEDTAIMAALHLLSIVAREKTYNRLLDIRIISPDYRSGNLTLHLRQRGTFSTGAQIILPSDKKAMEAALQRVEVIALNRLSAEQMTGFIDATYEINVPVRQKP